MKKANFTRRVSGGITGTTNFINCCTELFGGEKIAQNGRAARKWLFALSCLVAMVLFTGMTSFAQNNWTGAVDDDWNNGGNWSLGAPVAGQNLVIPVVATFPATFTGAAATPDFNRLTVDAGAVATIPGGYTLNIDGGGGDGIVNDGTIFNQGTINISNKGGDGIMNNAAGNFTNGGNFNLGVINISDIGNRGINNVGGTFNNGDAVGSGQINITGAIGNDAVRINGGLFSNSLDGTLNGTHLHIGQGGAPGDITGDGIDIRNGGIFNNQVDDVEVLIDNVTADGIHIQGSGDSYSNLGANAVTTIGAAGAGSIGDDGIHVENAIGNKVVNAEGTISISNYGNRGIQLGRDLDNATGGTINIDGTGSTGDGINVGADGVLDNVSGSTINISNAGANGLDNNGVTHNGDGGMGTINVTTSTDRGVDNSGSFFNGGATDTGTLDIDDSGNDGIRNTGNFENMTASPITVDNSGTGGAGSGIDNNPGATFLNEEASSITINTAANDGITNNGTFTSTGAGTTIVIGNTTGATVDGIFNDDTFLNDDGSDISIDNSGDDGIQNDGTFTNDNASTISIDNSTDDGFENNATARNDNGSTIGIETSGGHGINNATAFASGFVNDNGSTINIATLGGIVTGNGITNVANAFFSNATGSTINIDPVSDGINNAGAFLNIDSDINIDDAGDDGIDNSGGGFGGFFSNFALAGDANINIGPNIGSHGVNNSGAFNNAGQAAGMTATLHIDGATGTFGGSGIVNTGTTPDGFTNGGTATAGISNIFIDVVGADAINNSGNFESSALLGTGTAFIGIGTDGPGTIGGDGIDNTGTFDHLSASTIDIDRADGDGINNNGGGIFNNNGLVPSSATINIDLVDGDGINNDASIFNNNNNGSIINIGSTNPVDAHGVHNSNGATFQNIDGALLNIVEVGRNCTVTTPAHGILNDASTFTNGDAFSADVNIDETNCGNAKDGTGSDGVHNINGATLTNQTAGSTFTIGATNIIDDGVYNDGTSTINNLVGATMSTSNTGGHGVNNDGVFNNGNGGAATLNITAGAVAAGSLCHGYNGGTGSTFNNLGGSTVAITGGDDGYNSDGTDTNDGSTITIGDCAGADPADDGMELGANAFFINDNGGLIDIDGAGDDGLFTAGSLFNGFAGTGQIDIDCTGDDGFEANGAAGLVFNGFAVAGSVMNIGLNVAIGDDGVTVLGGAAFNNFAEAILNIDNAGGDGIEVGDGVNGGVLVNSDATINVLGVTGNVITNLVDGAISSIGTDADPILSVVNLLSGGAACDGTHPISNAGGIVAGNCSEWNVNAKVDNTPGGTIQVDDAYWIQECGGAISAMTTPADFTNNGVVYDHNRHFGHGTLLTNNDLVIDTDVSVSVSICDDDIPDILLNEIDAPQDAQAETTWYSDMARTVVAGTYNNATNTFTPVSTPMIAGNHTFYFLVHKNADYDGGANELDACATILGHVDILIRPECYQLTNFPGIGDPCSCLDDADVNGDNGTFAEEVAMAGVYNMPLPAGQTWTVVSMIGVYDMNDTGNGPGAALVATGAQPAGYTTYMFAGTEYLALEYNAVDGFYEIDFHHVEDQGYEIYVQGPNPDTDGDPTTIEPTNFLFNIGNNCFYPHPNIDVPSLVCGSENAFNVQVLGVDAALNERAAGEKFDDDADPTTAEAVAWLDGETGEIDPDAADFPTGLTTVYYHYDAPDAPAGTHAPGCLQTVSVDFTASPELTVTAAVDMNADCAGSQDGAATATAMGGTAPLAYLWSDGQTTASATGLAAGGYAVTVTDAVGCTAVAAVTITDPSGLTANITASSNVVCNGDSDGSATVTATGGTPPYSYAWSGSAATTATVTDLAAGLHSVTVTDMNGCEAFASVYIDEPTALLAEIIHTTDALCNGSSDGTATVNATGGVTPYTYAWPAPGSGTAATETGLAAGSYEVTVTDANGCVAMATATIGEPTAITETSVVVTDVSCNGGSDGSIDLTFSGGTGPYNVDWDNGAGDQEDPNGLAAGTYNYTVTDDNGCQLTGSATVNEPTALTDIPVTTDDVDCHGGADGSASVTPGGGTPPYVVTWSNGDTGTSTTTGLAAGGFAYTITDANGCTLVGGVTITEPTELVVATTGITDVDCNGAATGEAVFTASGGTPAYSYDIGGGGQASGTFSGLTAGTYVVTVTDANGCTAVTSATIDQPTLVALSVVASYDETCDGADDGWATVEANGGTTPYTYAWPAPGSQTTPTATGLADGTYTVTATDANGCMGTVDVTIGAGPALTISALGDIGPLCPGASVGDILLSATPYDSGISYSWTGGAAAGLVDGSSSGLNAHIPAFTASTTEQTVVITVTATFGAACSDTETFMITIDDSNSLTFVNCPVSFTVNTDVGKCGANVHWSVPVAADDCTNPGAIVVTQIVGAAPGSFFAPGTHTITYEADDGNGNTVTCSFDITVVDMENPVIQCASAAYTRGTNSGCDFVMGSADFDAAATDNCGVTSLVNSANGLATLAGHTFSLGNNSVTWTATDAAGNASTCVQVITVVDDDDPTNTFCPTDISVTTDPGVCEAVVAYASPTFADNCDGAGLAGTLTEGLASGSAFPEGTTEVEYEYTDLAGNGPATCEFTVTVSDLEIPTITCPPAVTTQCTILDVPPFANSNEFLAAGGFLFDNCELNWGTFGMIVQVEAPAGTFTRTYSIFDVHGNGNFCSHTVTVDDTTDPVAMCQDDYTVVLDADGLFEILVADINVGSYDNCGVLVRKEIDIDGGGFAGSGFVDCAVAEGAGSVTVTLEAEDASGNVGTCTTTVSVLDIDAPHIECANAAYVRGTNVDCTFEMMSTDLDATGSDNCTFAITNDYTGTSTIDGAVFPLGNTTVLWTATDASGNVATCSVTLTVVDDDAPTVDTCPGDDTVSNDAGVCGAAYAYADPTFDDNCDGAGLPGTLTEGLASGATFPVGTTTVTYEYTDAAGNGPAVCSFDVTVTDDEDPVLTCPADQDVQCSADEAAEYDNWVEFTAAGGTGSDNCALDYETFGLSGTATAGNVVTRTYTIDDEAGNSTTCTQDITILDTVDPVAMCQDDYSVVLDADGLFEILVTDIDNGSSDNCGFPLARKEISIDGGPFAGSDFVDCDDALVGTVTVTLEVEDDAGNVGTCTTDVSVLDVESPDIQCPTSNLLRGTNVDCSFTMGSDGFNAAATDNCGATLTNDYNGTDDLTGANFPLGNTTVVWTATDPSGNVSSCTMTITVVDDVDPTVDTCPTDISQTNDAGLCSAVVSYADPTFDDNCDGPGLAGSLAEGLASGSAFPVGTTTVTYVYTDAAGNGPAVCSFDVTVTDDEDPVLTCPAAATAQCSADEVAVADNVEELEAAGGAVSDNCDVNEGSFGLDSETTAGNVVTRTYRVEDIYGNWTTCTQDITILDTEDPEFVNCPTGPVVVGNDPDECSAKVNWSIPVATDNCDDVLVTVTQTAGPAPGSVIDVGTETVTYTATDLAGNSTECTFEVMVMDTQDPHIHVCPADRDIPTSSNAPAYDCMGAIPDMTGEVVFLENCPGAVVTQDPVAGTLFGGAPGDMQIVTFTVTDASGNTATCTNKLTLVDDEAPMAICTDLTVGLDVFGNASVTAADLAGGSFDNCTNPPTLEIVSGQTAYNCDDVGNTYDVVIRVTDSSGNSAECTATVTVEEGAATCDPNISINDPCVCSAITGYFDETVTVMALAGQTWTITAVNGLFSTPGNPITTGTTLTENPLGVYTLNAIHEGGVGYSIEVTNEFGQVLSVSNTCYLPEPSISGVDDFSTSCDDPFTVTGNENGVTGEAGTILTIDGPAGFHNEAAFPGPYQITVTPANLQPGDYEVCFALDAGVASNNDPNDPGCIVTVCETFTIISPVSGLTCNNDVNVSLDDECCVEITPDMVLEGDFGPDGVFEVTITDIIGTPLNPANEVCASHIGMDLIVTVTDPCTDQSCWGHLNVEDKLAPTVDCPADVTVYCNEDTEPGNTGYPVVDDCSAWDMDYTDDETFFDACDVNIRTIVRTFVVIDVHGNQAECTQTITVERPTLDDILFPKDVQWTCDNYAVFPNIIEPTALHPYVGDSDPATPNFCEVYLDETCDDDDGNLVGFCPTPFPGFFDDTKDRADINSTNTINGGQGCPGEVCGNNGLDDADVLELTGSGIPTLGGAAFQGVGACMLSVTWEDEWFEICSGSFEILRTWKVRDMCLPVSADNPRVHVQVIKVLDQSAPVLDCPASVTVSANVAATHPDECRADFFLPEIGVSDACSDGWTVEVDHPLGHIDGNGGFVSGLTRGTYEATYTVIDDCNNVATCEVEIEVVDNIAPTVQCDEITQVAVSSDGQVVVNAGVFDDGTHDNCCLDNFEVKRMGQPDSAFGPTETFTCNDINNSPITVVMRAYDCDDNYNDCMVQVYVEDKLQPILISCPGPASITCDTWWDEYEVPLALGQNSVLDGPFGTPEYTDNCNYTVNYTFNVNLDECGEGTITRTWQATDPSGNGPVTCTQVIFVDHVSDFAVEFPADVTYTCTQDAPDFGSPEVANESCELIAITYEDELFSSVPDACYKIKRTWTVINWCVVGDFVDQEVVESSERDFQLAGINPCDLDGDGDCDERTFRDSWNLGDRPTAANRTDQFGPDTDPDTDPWDGYITYEQHIKVIDNVAPVATCTDLYEVCIEDNTCAADFTVPAPDVQDCSSEISITADSDLPNFSSTAFTASNVAPGSYTVTFQIMDNCGNSTACQTEVVVEDCKKPTPYCKNGIIVEIMQTQMIEVWAIDLNDGSFDNCTDANDLVISFSGTDYVQGVTYTCDDLGFNNVEIWITDEAGNQDFCTTQIQVQDNMDHCGGGNPLVVDGTIMTAEDETVADVDVELNGGADMVTTTDNGQFTFTVTPGDDITLTPVKDIEPLNGVTTFDLVLMTKHILGVKLLDSPYKMIAADINKSETITTFDLVKLRKLILHIDDNFTNNTSWRFVDASYDFPDASNPWFEQFPEVANFNNIDVSTSADFIAVKIGDVNLSANPLGFTNADDRNKVNDLVFQVDDAELKAGETYTVDFTAKDFDVLGYQFTLNFDKDALEFVELLPGVAAVENFGTTLLEEGAITASWNDDAANVQNGEVVFSLVFTATADAQLSESLNVNSRYTPAEAYANDGELLDVALEFNGTVTGVFELYQNTPNPFEKTTIIGFNLPQADAATLTISDATGRVLQIIEGDYKKGYNEVELDRKSLNAAGVLYYQLETSTDIATKTMILVD